MRITITMVIDDELTDPGHATGLTEAGYDAITDALDPLGHDIDVSRA